MAKRTARIEIFSSTTPPASDSVDGEPVTLTYWRLRAANGEIVATGAEGYDKPANAKRAALRVGTLIPGALIVEVAS